MAAAAPGATARLRVSLLRRRASSDVSRPSLATALLSWRRFLQLLGSLLPSRRFQLARPVGQCFHNSLRPSDCLLVRGGGSDERWNWRGAVWLRLGRRGWRWEVVRKRVCQHQMFPGNGSRCSTDDSRASEPRVAPVWCSAVWSGAVWSGPVLHLVLFCAAGRQTDEGFQTQGCFLPLDSIVSIWRRSG